MAWITSIHGLVHIVLSLFNLVAGLFLTLRVFALGIDVHWLSGWASGASLTNGILLVCFYWKDFAPIYLSTTPTSKRGLSRRDVAMFHRARALALITNSLLALGVSHYVILFASISNMLFVLRFYDQRLAVADYGLIPFQYCVALLLEPNLDALYPMARAYVIFEGIFASTMIHWGFMFYALYTRRKISMENARTFIKWPHIILTTFRKVFYFRIAFWDNLPVILWPILKLK